jgi:hypothetical protein
MRGAAALAGAARAIVPPHVDSALRLGMDRPRYRILYAGAMNPSVRAVTRA